MIRLRRSGSWSLALVRRGLLLLLAMQVVFFGAILVSMTVPDGPIIGHLQTAIKDKTYGPDYPADGVGGILDRYTECIVITEGLTPAQAHLNAWDKALLTPRLTPCKEGVANISRLAAGEPDVQWSDYIRYWNGYAVITRPAMALWGLTGTRLLAGAVLLLSLAVSFQMVSRRAGTFTAIALMGPVVVGSNLLMSPLELSHAISSALAFAGMAIVLARARSAQSAALAAVLAGGLFVYGDLLTVPPMAWSLAAAGAGLGAWRHRRNARVMSQWTAAAAVGWAVGYGVTWMSRWAFGAISRGPAAVFRDIVEVGTFRVGGSYKTVSDRWGASTYANLRYWMAHLPTAKAIVVVSVAVIAVALVIAVTRNGRRTLAQAAVLAAPSLLVPLWYEGMKNHSQIHAFFTYRSIPVAMGIVLAAAVIAAKKPLAATSGGRKDLPVQDAAPVAATATPSRAPIERL